MSDTSFQIGVGNPCFVLTDRGLGYGSCVLIRNGQRGTSICVIGFGTDFPGQPPGFFPGCRFAGFQRFRMGFFGNHGFLSWGNRPCFRPLFAFSMISIPVAPVTVLKQISGVSYAVSKSRRTVRKDSEQRCSLRAVSSCHFSWMRMTLFLGYPCKCGNRYTRSGAGLLGNRSDDF